MILEKPGIEPATLFLQGIAHINYNHLEERGKRELSALLCMSSWCLVTISDV